MAFVRWVFYDTEGNVKYEGMQEGSFRHIPAEDVAASLGLTDVRCMEWRQKDPAVEAAFAGRDENGALRHVEVSVDVSGEEPKLVFAYTPVAETEGDDPYAIIDILTGGEA